MVAKKDHEIEGSVVGWRGGR